MKYLMVCHFFSIADDILTAPLDEQGKDCDGKTDKVL